MEAARDDIERHMKTLLSTRWRPTTTFLTASARFQRDIHADTFSCLRSATYFLGVIDQCAEDETDNASLSAWFRETRQMVEAFADRSEAEIRKALVA